MNQKKPFSHMVFLLFSLLVALVSGFAGKVGPSAVDILSVFILIFVQLEAFIFFGNMLFSKVNFDQNPGTITRIVLLRFIVFISLCLVAAMILYLMLAYSLAFFEGENLSKVAPGFFRNDFKYWFRSTISGLSGGALIFVILLWQTSLQREHKLREENLIFQNQTLKNQVNPHFLFNSLNTLSALIPGRPDQAERFLLKLSSIYRYILENSSKDAVPLESELAFISDYYYLHAIRDDGKIQLTVDAPEAGKYQILPVSLQILIENAIKHNSATRENPLSISISIENDGIVVKNNLQKMPVRMRSTGIGLNNLGERIRLSTGKKLVVEETQNEYIVKIPLIL